MYCVDHIAELSQAQIVYEKSAGLRIQSNGFVKTGSKVNYNARQSVELMNGFEIESGSTFHAFI